jgi:hypothetical protein
MPRFAILRHAGPRGVHWDLLLEAGASLRTWALEQEPTPDATIACQSLPDHRPPYLDYEGPVSGGRGTVARWDRGTYEIQRESADELILHLAGDRLCGRATLQREPHKSGAWRFVCTSVPGRSTGVSCEDA